MEPHVSSEELGTSAEVLFSFTKLRYDNLSLEKGEIITLIEMNENGWWKGINSNGDTGIFPYNYVKVVPSPAVVFKYVYVLFDYTAENEKELDLQQGEMVTLLDKASKDMWLGKTKDGRTGQFPISCVETTDEQNMELTKSEEQHWNKVEKENALELANIERQQKLAQEKLKEIEMRNSELLREAEEQHAIAMKANEALLEAQQEAEQLRLESLRHSRIQSITQTNSEISQEQLENSTTNPIYENDNPKPIIKPPLPKEPSPNLPTATALQSNKGGASTITEEEIQDNTIQENTIQENTIQENPIEDAVSNEGVTHLNTTEQLRELEEQDLQEVERMLDGSAVVLDPKQALINKLKMKKIIQKKKIQQKKNNHFQQDLVTQEEAIRSQLEFPISKNTALSQTAQNADRLANLNTANSVLGRTQSTMSLDLDAPQSDAVQLQLAVEAQKSTQQAKEQRRMLERQRSAHVLAQAVSAKQSARAAAEEMQRWRLRAAELRKRQLESGHPLESQEQSPAPARPKSVFRSIGDAVKKTLRRRKSSENEFIALEKSARKIEKEREKIERLNRQLQLRAREQDRKQEEMLAKARQIAEDLAKAREMESQVASAKQKVESQNALAARFRRLRDQREAENSSETQNKISETEEAIRNKVRKVSRIHQGNMPASLPPLNDALLDVNMSSTTRSNGSNRSRRNRTPSMKSIPLEPIIMTQHTGLPKARNKNAMNHSQKSQNTIQENNNSQGNSTILIEEAGIDEVKKRRMGTLERGVQKVAQTIKAIKTVAPNKPAQNRKSTYKKKSQGDSFGRDSVRSYLSSEKPYSRSSSRSNSPYNTSSWAYNGPGHATSAPPTHRRSIRKSPPAPEMVPLNDVSSNNELQRAPSVKDRIKTLKAQGVEESLRRSGRVV